LEETISLHIFFASRSPLNHGKYRLIITANKIELVSELENIGVHVLMNESVKLKKKSSSFYVVGVDDPFYFGFHDIEKAFKNVPENAFKIFLSHTPDLYKSASFKGANCYLCGHTHHGQVQFPLIGPLFLNTLASRKIGTGEWRYRDMTGFTGPGVGTSGPPVRFNCSPEITVLELKSSMN
jgi:predicted MPP superfamily phosphohydrolase